jgi:hypothetical protein
MYFILSPCLLRWFDGQGLAFLNVTNQFFEPGHVELRYFKPKLNAGYEPGRAVITNLWPLTISFG